MVIYSLSSPIPGFSKQAVCTGEVLCVCSERICAEVSWFYQAQCDRPIPCYQFVVAGRMSTVLIGLSANVHSKDIPWGKYQRDGCSFVVCTDLLFPIIFKMIYSAMKHHVVCLDMGVYTASWTYETAHETLDKWIIAVCKKVKNYYWSPMFNFLSQTFLVSFRIYQVCSMQSSVFFHFTRHFIFY